VFSFQVAVRSVQIEEPGIEVDDARLRVRSHLERIEARMPIDRVPAERRLEARGLRAWFRDEFTADPGEGRRESETDSP